MASITDPSPMIQTGVVIRKFDEYLICTFFSSVDLYANKKHMVGL